MTLDEFKALLLTADPKASHYYSVSQETNYTIWREHEERGLSADNKRLQPIWLVQVDRFTKTENDPIADAIKAALDSCVEISFRHLVDFEPDTKYIHHIFDCEVAH